MWARKKTFTAGEANKTVQIKLEKAPDSTLKDIELPTDWPLFRKNDENNGVVDVRTPITAEDTVLVGPTSWARAKRRRCGQPHHRGRLPLYLFRYHYHEGG